MRTRRLWTLMGLVLVLVVGLGLAASQEYRVWGPARRAREKYIRYHEGLAREYQRELTAPPLRPPDWPMDGILRQALTRLFNWHSDRAAELRRSGRFDPELERSRDRDTSPKPDDETVQEWLSNYHYPTIM